MQKKNILYAIAGVAFGLGCAAYALAGVFAAAPYALILWLSYTLTRAK